MSWVPKIPQELLAELKPFWRRRWIMIGCAWVFSLLGWSVVILLPDRYEAMTRIYVETENLLTPLLRNITVQADVQKQLEVLQKTLLNRNNMIKVAHATDLDMDAQSPTEKEQLYDALARQITVKAEGQNLFSVTFRSQNPQLAKNVVETLLNIFIETNLGQNRTSMENARNFLENQISEYELKLKQADQRLAEYKSQHYDLLASTGSNFTARLDSTRQSLEAAKLKYDSALAMRDQFRSALASTPQYLNVDTAPQVVINGSGNVAGGSARARVQQLSRELSSLQSRFTDQHPDVVAAKRALERAQTDLQEEESGKKTDATGASHGSASNPVYEQVKLRLIQAEGELAQAAGQLNMVKLEVSRLERLAETAPKVEAELADQNREYSVIKSKYEELLGRRESARISAAVETSGDKVQFRVIEAPQVPSRPTFPNRPLLATLVLVAGAGFGVAVVFLLQKLDETVTSSASLAEEFNVRVLGVVSEASNMLNYRARRRSGRRFAVASAGLVCAYGVFMAMTQMYQLSALATKGHLPAVLQRILDYAG